MVQVHAPITAAWVRAFISRLLDKLSLEGFGYLTLPCCHSKHPLGLAGDWNAPPDISAVAGSRDQTVADAHKWVSARLKFSSAPTNCRRRESPGGVGIGRHRGPQRFKSHGRANDRKGGPDTGIADAPDRFHLLDFDTTSTAVSTRPAPPYPRGTETAAGSPCDGSRPGFGSTPRRGETTRSISWAIMGAERIASPGASPTASAAIQMTQIGRLSMACGPPSHWPRRGFRTHSLTNR
jgi:hypothetical protein